MLLKKGAKIVLLMLALSFFAMPCFADYLMSSDIGQKVLIIIYEIDKSLLCEKPKVALSRAMEEGSGVLVDNMTKCITLSSYTYYLNIFSKKFLKRVLVTSGPERGTSGWVRAEAVSPGGSDGLEDFDSGEYVIRLRNGKALRCDPIKQEKKGISVSVFDGANDLFIKNDDIAQIYSLEKQ